MSLNFRNFAFSFCRSLMPDDGDRTLNINTFMGLGDGPQDCGKVNENNKKQ